MQQVRIHGRGDVRVDEVESPTPTSRDAVVSVAACGVCGSDLTYIRNGGVAGPTGTPMPLGHELAGVVTWVGDDVVGTAVGDRVVVHPGNDDLGRIGNGSGEGGLAPQVLVREAAAGGRLFPVADEMALEVAALAEPLAVGMRAVERAEASPGDKVAVFGCGPIGLFAIAALIDQGVTDVVAVDLSPTRLAIAAELGATAVINPTETDVWTSLADVHGTAPFMFGPTPATNAFIEATGSDAVLTSIIDNGRVGGRLSVVALHYRPIPVNFTMILMKEFSIHGSMEYPTRFGDALDLLARRDLSGVITHRVPLAAFSEAVELLSGSTDCGKVMITMG